MVSAVLRRKPGMEDMIVKRDVIGLGTYGEVHMAVYRDSDQKLAVKSSVSSQSSSLRREEAMFQYLGACPDIVKCLGGYSSMEDDGSSLYNLVLEYAPGGSLTGLMKKRRGKLWEFEARHYAKMMIRGLCYMHERGVVHCDVKPDNVLVFPREDGGNVVKLADFGLARRVDEEDRLWIQHRGSPPYMSPEALAWEEYEPPMDIWSLGCTVVEMVTGERVWSEKTVREIFDHVVVKRETPQIPEYLSECGKDFLARCFEWDPSRRWTAEMLMNDHSFVAQRPNQPILSDDSVWSSSFLPCLDTDEDDVQVQSSSSSSCYSFLPSSLPSVIPSQLSNAVVDRGSQKEDRGDIQNFWEEWL